MPSSITIYKFFDAVDDLLYVGITGRGPRRWVEHGATQPWWNEVARVEVEHEPDRRRAVERERDLIRDHQPKYNIVHNGGPRTELHQASRRGLVGMFVLTPDKDQGWPLVSHQGQVIDEIVEQHLYLVQWYEWMFGIPNSSELIQIDDMRSWHFYQDEEEWRFAGTEASKIRSQRMRAASEAPILAEWRGGA